MLIWSWDTARDSTLDIGAETLHTIRTGETPRTIQNPGGRPHMQFYSYLGGHSTLNSWVRGHSILFRISGDPAHKIELRCSYRGWETEQYQ